MKNQYNTLQKLNKPLLFVLLGAAICLMPFHNHTATIFSIIFSCLTIFSLDFNSFLSKFYNQLFLKPTLFFLLIIIVFSYATQNYTAAHHTLEVKAGLFVMPFLFYFNTQLISINYKYIFFAFTISLIMAMLYLLYVANGHYLSTQNINWFFYSSLSNTLMHPGYLSAFYFIIYLWSAHFYLNSKKIIYAAISLLFLVFIVLLSSKTIYLCVAISTILLLYFNNQFSIKQYIFTAIFAMIAAIGLYQIPFFKFRVNEAFQSFSYAKTQEVKTEDSSPARLVIWQCQWQLIKNNPWLGVGTGDGNDELHKVFNNTGHDMFTKRDVNSHNQFLHQWMEQGILGILSLLLFLIGFLVYFIKQKNTLGIIFIAVHFIILSTDIMFEIQAGTLFFAYFSSIFLVYNPFPHRRFMHKV
jgi:O-antigen ligase